MIKNEPETEVATPKTQRYLDKGPAQKKKKK